MIFQNLHTHTIFSDGKNTPVEMIESAIEKGFDVLGFSDHSPMPFPCSWNVPLAQIPEYRETIRSLAAVYRDKIEIALGLEVDRFTLPLTDRYDYTIGSTHYLYKDGVYLEIDHSRERQETAIREHFSGDAIAYARHYWETVADCIRIHRPNIVGHADVITKFSLMPEDDPQYRALALEGVDALLPLCDLFEVNTGAISRGYRTVPYPADWLVRHLASRGARFTLSSDCHNAPDLDCHYRESLAMLQANGVHTLWLYHGGSFSEYKIEE